MKVPGDDGESGKPGSSSSSGRPAPPVIRVPLFSTSRRYRPLAKNVLISGVLMMIGEVVAQQVKKCIEQFTPGQVPGKVNGGDLDEQHKDPNATDQTVCAQLHHCWEERQFSRQNVDVNRVVVLGSIGSFQGFYQHIYYTWLDVMLNGTGTTVVAKKVLLDELTVGPTSLCIFFFINGASEEKSMSGGIQRVRDSFKTAYLTDLLFWPFVQWINFAYVPSVYRVPYIAFFTCLWNTYLCVLNVRKAQKSNSPPRE